MPIQLTRTTAQFEARDCQRDVARRPRILLLTHRVPYPPNRGDRIRTYHLLRYLAARGRVWLGALADESVPAADERVLRELCEKVAIVPWSSKYQRLRAARGLLQGGTATKAVFRSTMLRNAVEQWGRQVQFDAVVAVCTSMASYFDSPALTAVPKFMDLIDVDSQKWLDYAAHGNVLLRKLHALEARRLQRLEARLLARLEAAVVTTQSEAELLESIGRLQEASAGARIIAIENGVDLEYFQPFSPGSSAATTNAEPHCVFTGVMNYQPNVDAVVWFANEIWPKLRAEYPHARFSIVGSQPVQSVTRLQHLPGIVVTGRVDDVRPYLAKATVCVVPLRIARGVQNKVLEAMAMGRPVVATSQALQGLAVEPSRHVRQADDATAFASAISSLFADRAAAESLGRSARQYVEQHHDWTRTLSTWSGLLKLPEATAAESPSPLRRLNTDSNALAEAAR